MRKLLYILIISFLACFFSSCSSNDEAPNMRINLRNLSDLRIYVGSPSGTKEIDITTAFTKIPITNLDSLRLALARKYFATPLATVSDSCSKITYEFLSDKLVYVNTYTNPSGLPSQFRQVISPYTFRNDSLFANLSGGDETYVGLGTGRKQIYAQIGFMMYPIDSENNRSVSYLNTDSASVEKAIDLSYIANLENMTNEKDTIAVCNVKYIYN